MTRGKKKTSRKTPIWHRRSEKDRVPNNGQYEAVEIGPGPSPPVFRTAKAQSNGILVDSLHLCSSAERWYCAASHAALRLDWGELDLSEEAVMPYFRPALSGLHAAISPSSPPMRCSKVDKDVDR